MTSVDANSGSTTSRPHPSAASDGSSGQTASAEPVRSAPVDFDALMQAHLARVFNERDAGRVDGRSANYTPRTPRFLSRMR
jgi:hypothetical protein